MQKLARNLSNSKCSKLNKTRGYWERDSFETDMVGSVEGDSSRGCTVLVTFSKIFNLRNSTQTQGDVIMYGPLPESPSSEKKH